MSNQKLNARALNILRERSNVVSKSAVAAEISKETGIMVSRSTIYRHQREFGLL